MTVALNESAVASTLSFGQRIESALAVAWADAEDEGQAIVGKIEQFGEQELAVIENAIVMTWDNYAPKAVALIKSYVVEALNELGSGASVEQVAQSVVAKDALSGAQSFLEGAVSSGLKAIVAALIASL